MGRLLWLMRVHSFANNDTILSVAGPVPPPCSRNSQCAIQYLQDGVFVVRTDSTMTCCGRFEALRREGFVGDVVTYNTLLKACMRARDGPRAEQAHRAMLEAGIRGDEVTYNTVVKALAYAAEDARPAGSMPLLTAAAVAEPRASGWDLQKVCTGCVESSLSSQWFAHQHNPGTAATPLACENRQYACVLPAGVAVDICRVSRVIHAVMQLSALTPIVMSAADCIATEAQVRWMMEADGYRPQGRVWGSLITACGKAGQLGSAEVLWTEMLAAGVAPAEDQYQALMNACVWTFQVLACLTVSSNECMCRSCMVCAPLLAVWIC